MRVTVCVCVCLLCVCLCAFVMCVLPVVCYFPVLDRENITPTESLVMTTEKNVENVNH